MLAGVLIAALYGLVIGSFLNALVWRVHVGRSIAKGRSVCSNCNHVLGFWDLIPVFSWLWLRGKCRYCHKPISDNPLVEAATAVLFGLSYAVLMPTSHWQ
jgi:leader peptidase (prepilin peptidase)/N-methyltransferase